LSLAGYSAWLIVDASIELAPNVHQCSPELVAVSSISRTQDTSLLWSLDFAATVPYASLESSTSKTLHLNTHGGFTLLVDVTYDSSVADQALFSVEDPATGFRFVASFDGSTSGYRFGFAKPYQSVTTISSAAVPAGRNVVAFRYQAYTEEMVVYSVAGNGSLARLAQVNSPLLSAKYCCVAYCLLLDWRVLVVHVVQPRTGSNWNRCTRNLNHQGWLIV
jgi:hypothetical protein